MPELIAVNEDKPDEELYVVTQQIEHDDPMVHLVLIQDAEEVGTMRQAAEPAWEARCGLTTNWVGGSILDCPECPGCFGDLK